MEARMKSGKIIKGKLAELFVKKGIAVEITEEEFEQIKQAKKPGRKPGKKVK